MLNLGFWQNRVQLLFLLKVRRSRFPVISSDKDFEGSASVNYAGVLKQRKFDFQYQMRNEHPTVIVKIYLKAQACKLFILGFLMNSFIFRILSGSFIMNQINLAASWNSVSPGWDSELLVEAWIMNSSVSYNLS